MKNFFLFLIVIVLIVVSLNVDSLKNVHAFTSSSSNLVANPGAENNSMDGWSILSNPGPNIGENNGWTASNDMAYSGTYSFATSYDWDTRYQKIDLYSNGYSASDLDSLQPEISFGEWVASRGDCGGDYYIKFELLGNDGDASNPIKSYNSGTQGSPNIIPSGTTWFQVSNTFSDYGAGVRYVYIEDGGKDECYWAGDFGTHFDDASIIVAGINSTDTTTPTPTTDSTSTDSASGTSTPTSINNNSTRGGTPTPTSSSSNKSSNTSNSKNSGSTPTPTTGSGGTTDAFDTYNIKINISQKGKPISGIDVELHSIVVTVTTDKSGNAIFTNVEKGSHKIIFTYNGQQIEKSLNVGGSNKDINLAIAVPPNDSTTNNALSSSNDKSNKGTSFWMWIIIAAIIIVICVLIYFLRQRFIDKKNEATYQ